MKLDGYHHTFICLCQDIMPRYSETSEWRERSRKKQVFFPHTPQLPGHCVMMITRRDVGMKCPFYHTRPNLKAMDLMASSSGEPAFFLHACIQALGSYSFLCLGLGWQDPQEPNPMHNLYCGFHQLDLLNLTKQNNIHK